MLFRSLLVYNRFRCLDFKVVYALRHLLDVHKKMTYMRCFHLIGRPIHASVSSMWSRMVFLKLPYLISHALTLSNIHEIDNKLYGCCPRASFYFECAVEINNPIPYVSHSISGTLMKLVQTRKSWSTSQYKREDKKNVKIWESNQRSQSQEVHQDPSEATHQVIGNVG